MKQSEPPNEVLADEVLSGVTEELLLVGIDGAFEGCRWSGDLPVLVAREALPGELEEGVLPIDRVVALQDVLVVRIPPMAFDAVIVVDPRMPFAVAI